jgi:hypothetical protein
MYGRTFNETVKDIIDHRRSNPRFNLSTDWNAVCQELDEYTSLRLRSVRGADGFLAPDDFAKKAMHPPFTATAGKAVGAAIVERGVKILSGAKRNIAGVATLIEWLGSGAKPVPETLANIRSGVCLTCPQNKPTDWKNWAKGQIAESIRRQIAIKNDMALKTANDPKLGTCEACSCVLQLKVWCPISHILKNMDGDTLKRLDPKCWCLSEKP